TEESQGVKRCPQCAFEMSEEALICLECGFNTLTRTRLTTLKTYETTSSDRMSWRLPGILCAVGFFLMVGVAAFLWLVCPGLAEDEWWGHLFIRVWGTI